MRRVLESIINSLDKGERIAMVVLTEVTGSAPGTDNAMMSVNKSGRAAGTVGGGRLEGELIKRSIKALEEDKGFSFRYDLNEGSEIAMSCGGMVEGFVKIFSPKKKLIVFGAGHVSQKIAGMCKNLDFDVFVFDGREEFKELPEFGAVKKYFPKDGFHGELSVDEDTYIIIATRDHAGDLEAIRSVINLGWGYLGMIGSRKKVTEIMEALERDGVRECVRDRVYAPIGLDISNGSPEEIAVSILSEILLIKNSGGLRHKKIRNS